MILTTNIAPYTAGIDLDNVHRYDHRGAMMVPDVTDDYCLISEVRAALARQAAPAPAQPAERVAAFKTAFHAAHHQGANYDDAVSAGLAAALARAVQPAPVASEELRSSLRELVDAMRRYQADVDDLPTVEHRDMMWRAERLIDANPAPAAQAITASVSRQIAERAGLPSMADAIEYAAQPAAQAESPIGNQRWSKEAEMMESWVQATATPQAPADEQRQAARDAVAGALSGLYYCGRVWSAWSVGTMSEDDFSPADEDDDIIENVVDAAINAMVLVATSQAAPAEVRFDEAWAAEQLGLGGTLSSDGKKKAALVLLGARRAAASQAAPVPMILNCPKCHTQHVDAPEPRFADNGEDDTTWTNPPHRSHLCHGCGHIWRPADVPTVGVAAIETRGKNDLPQAAPVGAAEFDVNSLHNQMAYIAAYDPDELSGGESPDGLRAASRLRAIIMRARNAINAANSTLPAPAQHADERRNIAEVKRTSDMGLTIRFLSARACSAFERYLADPTQQAGAEEDEQKVPTSADVQADEAKLYRDLTGDAMALGFDGIPAALEVLRKVGNDLIEDWQSVMQQRLYDLRKDVSAACQLLADNEWAERFTTTPEGRALESEISRLVSRAIPTTTAAMTSEDARDAARWRGFIGSARIRPLGSTGLNQPEPDNYAHMGLEIWTTYSRDFSPKMLEQMDSSTALGRDWLTKYADVAIAAMRATQQEGGK